MRAIAEIDTPAAPWIPMRRDDDWGYSPVMAVVVRLGGGLGNQMFQYAAARAAAARTDQALVLDLEYGARFLLDIFRLAPYRCLTPTSAIRAGLPPWRPRRGVRAFSRFSRARHLKATTFGTFLPDVVEATGPIVLSGHWQSERYFEDAADAIRREFTSRQISAGVAGLAEEMRSTPSVAVSFRRGDYLTAVPAEDLPTEDFYTTAYEAMRDKPQVYGFSDDPAWLTANLERIYPGAIQVSGRVSQTLADEITLHAAARHQIIPPSSFSWWAAWLNPYERKHVIAPRRWVWDWAAPDVVPDSWARA